MYHFSFKLIYLISNINFTVGIDIFIYLFESIFTGPMPFYVFIFILIPQTKARTHRDEFRAIFADV